MTDKYCPLRFREFGSSPHDQRCIGDYCAWFDKCSQSHGEPRTATVEMQTRVRTETDAEELQKPQEADENANGEDTREKLYAELQTRVDELTTERDYWKRQYELICRAVEDVARNYSVVDEDGEVIS